MNIAQVVVLSPSVVNRWSMSDWIANTYEDRLLKAYHQKVGGRMYTEVAIPYSDGYKEWPEGYSNRYIDAVRLDEPFYDEEDRPVRKAWNRGVQGD